MEAFTSSENIVFLFFFSSLEIFLVSIILFLVACACMHTHIQKNSPQHLLQKQGTWGRQLESLLSRKALVMEHYG